MRGHQVDFVAGGTAAFIRLRPTDKHPGVQLEAWSMDSAEGVNPGDPNNPDWVGMVGRDQLFEVALAALRLLGYPKAAQALSESWFNRQNVKDDDIAVRQFRTEYGPRAIKKGNWREKRKNLSANHPQVVLLRSKLVPAVGSLIRDYSLDKNK